MAEALGVATSVLQLLQVTWTVAYELKKFHDSAAVIGKTISDLKHDVEGLVNVLESMRDTFETITAEHGSGHVGTLWTNVARSIEDGKGVLNQIQSQIREVNRETKFLDEYRKQLRLNRSEPQMARFRVQIQSYRDGLQLSLQTIIIWNQISFQKSTDQVLPNLSNLHDDVRRIGLELNARIEALQSMVASRQDETQVIAMRNLRDCVRSAASTISSATTITAPKDHADQNVISSSDFGDVFPVQYNETMRRWVDSNTIYEYDAAASKAPPESVADLPDAGEGDHSSDSDVDLEEEMMHLLLDAGKQKLSAGDTKGGERLLRSCLQKIESSGSAKGSRGRDVVGILYDLYFSQQKWPEAEKMLLQKMSIEERFLGKNDPGLLEDIVSLVKVYIRKGNLVEAQLQARRALKGYKKLKDQARVRDCLVLLIDICGNEGNDIDQEQYTIMLLSLDHPTSSTAAVPFSSRQILPQDPPQTASQDCSGDQDVLQETKQPSFLAPDDTASFHHEADDKDSPRDETGGSSSAPKRLPPLIFDEETDSWVEDGTSTTEPADTKQSSTLRRINPVGPDGESIHWSSSSDRSIHSEATARWTTSSNRSFDTDTIAHPVTSVPTEPSTRNTESVTRSTEPAGMAQSFVFAPVAPISFAPVEAFDIHTKPSTSSALSKTKQSLFFARDSTEPPNDPASTSRSSKLSVDSGRRLQPLDWAPVTTAQSLLAESAYSSTKSLSVVPGRIDYAPVKPARPHDETSTSSDDTERSLYFAGETGRPSPSNPPRPMMKGSLPSSEQSGATGSSTTPKITVNDIAAVRRHYLVEDSRVGKNALFGIFTGAQNFSFARLMMNDGEVGRGRLRDEPVSIAVVRDSKVGTTVTTRDLLYFAVEMRDSLKIVQEKWLDNARNSLECPPMFFAESDAEKKYADDLIETWRQRRITEEGRRFLGKANRMEKLNWCRDFEYSSYDQQREWDQIRNELNRAHSTIMKRTTARRMVRRIVGG